MAVRRPGNQCPHYNEQRGGEWMPLSRVLPQRITLRNPFLQSQKACGFDYLPVPGRRASSRLEKAEGDQNDHPECEKVESPQSRSCD
jgi:hypothetical protein